MWRLLALTALVVQTLDASPGELLKVARPLVPAEIETVLAASRGAIAGKSFRLTLAANGSGPEVVMGSNGRPRFVRTRGGMEGGIVGGVVNSAGGATTPSVGTRWHDELITIVEYTNRMARRCDGSAMTGELVIEYEHRRSTDRWTVTARTMHTLEALKPIFDALAGVPQWATGARRDIGGRAARALVAPWTPPPGAVDAPPVTGDPMPNVKGERPPREATQSLWIDVDSLLPLRWEVALRQRPAYGLTLTYEPFEIQPPEGVTAPDCIR